MHGPWGEEIGRLALRAALMLLALAGLAALAAGRARADEAEQIYQPLTMSRIDLGLSQEAIEALEAEPDEYVKGIFSLAVTDGTPDGPETPLAENVHAEIRLKGSASFEGLGEKPAFKIKFKKSERFLGLRKMTLNNMVQDPSMIHEMLGYAAFRAAGVPVPRTGYAEVSLNGQPIGVELDLETPDVEFLERQFGAFDEATQHLYEGEKGTDVIPGEASKFEVDEGEEGSIADLEALIAAVAAEGGPFSTRVAPNADLQEMTSMWAVEKYIGQWDGYSTQVDETQPNNYYLYSGPTGVFQMLPWDLDQTWHKRLAFDSRGGILFDDCLEDESCASRYRAALGFATSSIRPAGLGGLAEEAARLLGPWQQLEQRQGRPSSSTAETAEAVAETEQFLADRPAEAEAWLAGPSPAPAPVSVPPGSSTPARTACVVPKLTGRKLKEIKRAARAAHCRIAKVTRARGIGARRGVVVKQSPRPGRELPANATIAVRIGPKP